ncbi:MAG: hypothetical protein U0401_31195 [Anaerolineae bacterium]
MKVAQHAISIGPAGLLAALSKRSILLLNDPATHTLGNIQQTLPVGRAIRR